MAEVYVTLGEAAELEGVKYKTMAQRLSRKKETFVTKTEKSETGGKDVVLVAVSSLSKQARNAWKEREKLKSFTEEFPDKKEDEQKPEVPWYVNTDVDWYIENYKERYYKAVELALLVKDIQDSHIIRVILDVNLPPDIVTKLIRAVLISPLGNANVTDKHVL